MMSSVIASEIYALARRYRLRRHIPGREDITGSAPIAPRIEREILFQLTAGLDYRVGAPPPGYPLPVGGYYERYCFSPIVSCAVNNGALDPSHLHDLPLNESAYFEHFERTTGIVRASWDDLNYVSRLDPTILWHIGEQVLAADPVAWTLLMSNEFDLAVEHAPLLRKPLLAPIFKGPAIDMFKMPAQIERGRLILRHVADANAILQRDDLIDILMAPEPLGEYLGAADVIHLSRLIEYTALSTNELRNFVLAYDSGAVTKATAKFLNRLAKITDADIPVGIADTHELRAALAEYLRNPKERTSQEIVSVTKNKANVVADAVAPGTGKATRDGLKRPTGTPSDKRQSASVYALSSRNDDQGSAVVNRGGRKSTLQRDVAMRWYGLTTDDGPVVILNEIREWASKGKRIKNDARFPHLKTFASTEHYRFALSRLANAFRKDVDAKRQRELEARATKVVAAAAAKIRWKTIEKNLHSLTKMGERMTKRYLPLPKNLGAAVRFSPPNYGRKSSDWRLWKVIQNWSSDERSERNGFRRQITPGLFRRFAFGMFKVRQVFSELFAIGRPSDQTAAIAADLAAAVSPISANPTWVVGMGRLFASPKLVAKLRKK